MKNKFSVSVFVALSTMMLPNLVVANQCRELVISKTVEKPKTSPENRQVVEDRSRKGVDRVEISPETRRTSRFLEELEYYLRDPLGAIGRFFQRSENLATKGNFALDADREAGLKIMSAIRGVGYPKNMYSLKSVFGAILENLHGLSRSDLGVIVSLLHKYQDLDFPAEAWSLVGEIGSRESALRDERKADLFELVATMKKRAHKNQDAMKYNVLAELYDYVRRNSPFIMAFKERSKAFMHIRDKTDRETGGGRRDAFFSALVEEISAGHLPNKDVADLVAIYRNFVSRGMELDGADFAVLDAIKKGNPTMFYAVEQVKSLERKLFQYDQSQPRDAKESAADYAKRIERERREREQREREEREAKKTLVEDVKKALTERTIVAQTLRDNLGYAYLKKNLSGRTVSLLLGSAVDVPAATKAYVELAHKLAEDGYIVLFDGESTAAPQIAAAVGSKGIALSASSRQLGPLTQSIVIANDYIRASAFTETDKVVISSDSVAGFGLLIHNKAHIVFDPLKQYKTGLSDWKSYLGSSGFNLGVDTSGKPTPTSSIEKAIEEIVPRWGLSSSRSSLPKFEIEEMVDKVDLYQLRDLYNVARETSNDMQDLVFENGEALPPGGVVLGSSQNHGKFTQNVYDVVRAFADEGVPMATGGSGGFMEVANAAAYDAGAPSIGIPLGRGYGLASEKRVALDSQTKTIYARGYEQRIPYLLYKRKLLIFAPGGSGTIKELDVAFATMARNFARGRTDEFLVFIGTEYYQKLVTWLKASNLPESIRDRIYLVDTYEQAKEVYKAYEATGADMGQMRVANQVRPRNSNKTFKGRPYTTWEPPKPFSVFSNTSLRYSDGTSPNNNGPTLANPGSMPVNGGSTYGDGVPASGFGSGSKNSGDKAKDSTEKPKDSTDKPKDSSDKAKGSKPADSVKKDAPPKKGLWQQFRDDFQTIKDAFGNPNPGDPK